MSDRQHHDHDHDHDHGTLTLEDRHGHEAEIYDAMAADFLSSWTEDEYRVDPNQIPFHNREQVDYVTRAITALGSLDGKRILEVGAGGGSLAVWLALQGAEVVGIDVSGGILEVAAKRAEVSGVADRTTFVHSPIETFEEPDGSFDAILGNNVVHHFELDLAMANIARMLKPEGRAEFCEPVFFIPEVFRTARNSSAVTRFFPMRTHTPDERSLNRGDLEVIAKYFGDVEWEPVQLLCRLQNFVELSDPMFNRLEALDHKVLDKVKASRSLCRMIVLHLNQPRVP